MKKDISKLESLIVGVAIVCSCSLLFVGCKKTAASNKQFYTSEQTINEIKNDTDFYNYIYNLDLLINRKSPPLSYEINTNKIINTDEMDEQKFISMFKESIENNSESKKTISNYMGFENINDFWKIRALLNLSLANLIKKYDLTIISKTQWYELFKGVNKTNQIQNSSNLKNFMMSPDNCIEQYKDCVDDANAQYAVEALGCAGWGALGWTVIGGVLFVGCEGLSYYHLTTMKRKCESSYKTCK